MFELPEISERLKTQDNRITSSPIFVVEQSRRFGVFEFVQACFTEAAAQQYIDENKHNLKKPRIYVYSGDRNREWQAVRKHLMEFQD